MLPITTCTVCKRFTKLFQYSIESIVDMVDEILIFDDSSDTDLDETDFTKFVNVSIIRGVDLGNDLGKKKQYLSELAKNQIVMRWDDDFILYNTDLLQRIYVMFQEQALDFVITYNYNMSYTLDHVKTKQPYCTEIYIYKKGVVTFTRYKEYPDYPALCKPRDELSSNTIDECLFLHMSNFKSYEYLLYRSFMCEFCNQTDFSTYYEWLFFKENQRICHIQNEMDDFKRIKNNYIRSRTYPINSIQLLEPPLCMNNLDPLLVTYIRDKFKIIKTSEITFRYDITL